MDFAQWLSLFSICLLGAMAPGPSLAVLVANSPTVILAIQPAGIP